MATDQTKLISPYCTGFEGGVPILIRPQNGLATLQFADFVCHNGRATLIGETAGGDRR